MSQNSHVYGQPLENWTLARKYSRRSISPYAGRGKSTSAGGRPCAWARAITSVIRARCTCMPEVSTASAQRKSASLARREFSSTKRTSQVSGRYAAVTSRPCGGMKARTRRPKGGRAGARGAVRDLPTSRGAELAVALGAAAPFTPADVTSGAEVERALGEARQRLGGLNVLVNCAGIGTAPKTVSKGNPARLEGFTRGITA